jgi:hypothetical protein
MLQENTRRLNETSGLQEKSKKLVKRGCKCKNVDAYETNAEFCQQLLVIPLSQKRRCTYLTFIL